MRETFLRAVRPIAAMAGILALGMTTPARADLVIQLSVNGTSWTTVADEPSGTSASYTSPSTNFSGFSIQSLTTASNSPGDSGFADLLGSDTSITNKNTSAATLYIKLSDTDFTSPYTPGLISVDSHVGGTVIRPGSGNLMTFQSYIDPADGEATEIGFTPGAQDKATGLSITSGSFSSDAYLNITSGLTLPYAITESFQITLSKGSEINFSSSTTLTSAVPEPSSLVLAGLGALGVGGFALRRKARGR